MLSVYNENYGYIKCFITLFFVSSYMYMDETHTYDYTRIAWLIDCFKSS